MKPSTKSIGGCITGKQNHRDQTPNSFLYLYIFPRETSTSQSSQADSAITSRTTSARSYHFSSDPSALPAFCSFCMSPYLAGFWPRGTAAPVSSDRPSLRALLAM